MPKKRTPRPTDVELAILGLLWENGPSTVRQVHEVIGKDRDTRYTTTLKFMQNMFEKGILLRDDSRFAHVYRPAVSAERTQKQVLRHLLDRAFGGSAEKLVMRALSARKISPEELARIREMIDEMGG